MKNQIIEIFVDKVKSISEEWTREIAHGGTPVHTYSNQIYHIHNMLSKIIDIDEEKIY